MLSVIGEWHEDPREIANMSGLYTLQHMPRRPDFALQYPYEHPEAFQAPAKGGDPEELRCDPYWMSDKAWEYVGMFTNPEARTNSDFRRLDPESIEYLEYIVDIRENLRGQIMDGQSSKPTLLQLCNFSDVYDMLKPVTDNRTSDERIYDWEIDLNFSPASIGGLCHPRAESYDQSGFPARDDTPGPKPPSAPGSYTQPTQSGFDA